MSLPAVTRDVMQPTVLSPLRARTENTFSETKERFKIGKTHKHDNWRENRRSRNRKKLSSGDGVSAERAAARPPGLSLPLSQRRASSPGSRRSLSLRRRSCF